MINGKETITPGAIYRLKIQSEAQFELSAINFVAAKPPRYGAP
jgi:hypothetical protein